MPLSTEGMLVLAAGFAVYGLFAWLSVRLTCFSYRPEAGSRRDREGSAPSAHGSSDTDGGHGCGGDGDGGCGGD